MAAQAAVRVGVHVQTARVREAGGGAALVGGRPDALARGLKTLVNCFIQGIFAKFEVVYSRRRLLLALNFAKVCLKLYSYLFVFMQLT